MLNQESEVISDIDEEALEGCFVSMREVYLWMYYVVTELRLNKIESLLVPLCKESMDKDRDDIIRSLGLSLKNLK